MGWYLRVLRGRLRDQAPVVLVVTAVAVVATTLVGVLATLLHVVDERAVPTTLARVAPEQVQLEATVWVNGVDAVAALDSARAGLATITGDVPTSEDVWVLGESHAVASTEPGWSPLTYFASVPRPDDHARLDAGRWPRSPGADGVEVAVPTVAAEELGWVPGTVVRTSPWGTLDARSWVVVGTYTPTGPPGTWSRDRLRGDGVDRNFNVPGAAGMITTVAWGPLLVDDAVLTGDIPVDTAYVVVTPDLAAASARAVADMRERVRDGSALLSEAFGDVTSGRLVTTVGTTIDATWRQAVVTRAGVATTGLLLGVLATTVMLLVARLLADRRATERELLAARGGSPHQLRSVVVLEAVLLAAVTCAIAPWLARLAVDQLLRTDLLADTGYVTGPGIPVPVLLACAVTSAVLAVALCVPAWHTTGSSSVTAHAGLLRAGGDLALVALAGLAVWQLVAYGSPLTTGPTGPRVDPVLVAGPALVTLAAGTVALRLVAPVARGADRLAARARSFVGPLAAWQVARRSSVATGTVLVVVVAVVAGGFATAFLATWRTSQVEQSDLAAGTDLRVDGLPDDPLVTAATLATATAAHPDAAGQPVTYRRTGIGHTGQGSGIAARLLALDTDRPQDVRGFTPTPWDDVFDGLAVAGPSTGAPVPVPPATQWLAVRGLVATQPASSGQAMVSITVAGEHGVLEQLPPRSVPVGEEFHVGFELPDAQPLRVVAVGVMVALDAVPDSVAHAALTTNRIQNLPVVVEILDVRALPRTLEIRHDTEAAQRAADGAAVALPATGWTAAVRQPPSDPTAPPHGPLEATVSAAPGLLRVAGRILVTPIDAPQVPPVHITLRSWPQPEVVPAVVTDDLLRTVDVSPGRTLDVTVGGSTLTVRVQRVVAHLPGVPHGVGVLVDRESLVRAAVDLGEPTDLLDAWWVAAPDATAQAIGGDVADQLGADVTARSDRQREALSGPVRVAVPAALLLVVGASGVLLLAGVGAVTAASVRARRTELARLQALGASRGGLARGLVAEAALLVGVGTVVGVGAGYGLAAAVAPLLTMSSDGRAPVPAPWLVWDWAGHATQILLTAAGACLVVLLVAVCGLRRTSGSALRMGDDL